MLSVPFLASFFNFYFQIFLAMPHGMWDLGSPTGVWTHTPLHWKHRVLTTGPPEKFPFIASDGTWVCPPPPWSLSCVSLPGVPRWVGGSLAADLCLTPVSNFCHHIPPLGGGPTGSSLGRMLEHPLTLSLLGSYKGTLQTGPASTPDISFLFSSFFNHQSIAFFFNFCFISEYSWFTMSCQFQVYSTVFQLHIYMYLVYFMFFSHLSYSRMLNRVPCAMQ